MPGEEEFGIHKSIKVRGAQMQGQGCQRFLPTWTPLHGLHAFPDGTRLSLHHEGSVSSDVRQLFSCWFFFAYVTCARLWAWIWRPGCQYLVATRARCRLSTWILSACLLSAETESMHCLFRPFRIVCAPAQVLMVFGVSGHVTDGHHIPAGHYTVCSKEPAFHSQKPVVHVLPMRS
jgi:hypothetical protein